jgi:ubiquinone/menaquinone biosynthesis C-methylase UbiE
MNNQHNLTIYRLYAPVYDVIMRPLTTAARQRALELLYLQPGERLLIPGAGTGLDLPHIPAGIHITATDLSPAMLQQARDKANRREVAFQIADAGALGFPSATFDAVLLSLILSVVPDGATAFQEAWRVLRPGGRAVIFDKFVPESSAISPLRRAVGAVIAWLGTDPNRRLSDILPSSVMQAVEQDEPSLLRGQYRIVLLRKPTSKR